MIATVLRLEAFVIAWVEKPEYWMVKRVVKGGGRSWFARWVAELGLDRLVEWSAENHRAGHRHRVRMVDR
jgi:hypothetical protein